MGSRLLRPKKLGARISLATLTAQIALGSLMVVVSPMAAIAIVGPTPCTTSDVDIAFYLKFDETSGTTANDSSVGGSMDGTHVNTPAISADYAPVLFDNIQSLSFDGINDYVDLGNPGFATPSSFSVSTWVKSNSIGIDRQIVSKGYNGTQTEWELKTTTADGKLSFQTFNGARFGVEALTPLTDATWTHVVGTFDGTTWKIYLNGVLNNSAVASAPVASGRPIYVGAVDANGTPAQFWSGNIDDIRFFGRALTATEVSNLAAGQCAAMSVSSSSNSSSSFSSSSSSSSSAPSDTDEDGVPDALVCTSTFTMMCTPMPDMCTPQPPICIEEVCTPQPDMCTPQPPMCIPVPSMTCTGPDNCPVTPNPDQADSNENSVGNACEIPSSSSANNSDNDENEDDGGNGSYRGSRTNVLRSIIAMFGGPPTGLPPAAFGGPGDGDFSDADKALLCRVLNAMADDAGYDVYVWAASELSLRIPHSVGSIIDALRRGDVCPEIVAKVEKAPKPIAFRVDAFGYPVSSNDTWNKCVRGTATLQDIRDNSDRDEDGYGKSCSYYKADPALGLWKHPDLRTLFTWKRSEMSLSLPAGYALKQDQALTQK